MLIGFFRGKNQSCLDEKDFFEASVVDPYQAKIFCQIEQLLAVGNYIDKFKICH